MAAIILDSEARIFKVKFILSYFDAVKVFCLKHKISITNELIGFSILGKLHVSPVMFLCNFIFRLVSSYFLASFFAL